MLIYGVWVTTVHQLIEGMWKRTFKEEWVFVEWLTFKQCDVEFDVDLHSPAHVVQWSNHLGAMCSRAWRSLWPRSIRALARARPPTKKELFQIIRMHMMTREIIPGRKTEGSTISYKLWPFVSDTAIFVLKRDVKLQLTNCRSVCPARSWALSKQLNRSRCRLGYGLGSAQGNVC